MKKNKFTKVYFNKIYACVILSIGIIFTNNLVLAAQQEKLKPLYTEEFTQWQELTEEEKEKTQIPRTYTTFATEEFLEKYDQNRINFVNQILTRSFMHGINENLIGTVTYNSPQYNLNSDMEIDVKHQGNTSECWAFSVVSALETNLELNKNIEKKFSPRHMDYATARTFIDGINPLGYAREVGDGGLSMFGLSYLTNGQGAVLESDMPFENNENLMSLEELDKDVDTIVTSYVSLPAIYKKYAIDNGEVVYTNGGKGPNLIIYEDEEIEQMRNIIKNHIIKYGAISAVTAANQAQFYNNSHISKATAYFCNDNRIVRDHAVTIVGWDDNYSKDNFTGVAKPYNDGAYIVLNSYGTENFDNGYLYISYEDSLIETLLYGIKSTSDLDYDNLYQYNPYGDNSALGITGTDEGYIAAVYDRDISKYETVNYVGVSIPDNVSLEIYINPNGNNTVINELTKVAETEVLEVGYHRIPITPTKLTGNNFAIVIKQKSTENRFYFSIETGIKNSNYENVTGNPGKTLYSYDGYAWNNLSSEKMDGLDMLTTDICIKAFTEFEVEPILPNEKPTDKPDDNPSENPDSKPEEEPDIKEEISISSSIYDIRNEDIYKIQYNTTVEKFKSNFETNSKIIEIYNENNLVNDDELIKTGMILKLEDEKEYNLIVRGDVNCTGTISLIDFSKIIANYTEDPRYALKGNSLKAADLNCDERISLIDISQMIILYTSIDN